MYKIHHPFYNHQGLVDSQYFQEFVALLSIIKLEKLGNHQQKVKSSH